MELCASDCGNQLDWRESSVTLGDGSVLHVIIEDQNVAWRLIQLPYCCKWKQDVGTTCGPSLTYNPQQAQKDIVVEASLEPWP